MHIRVFGHILLPFCITVGACNKHVTTIVPDAHLHAVIQMQFSPTLFANNFGCNSDTYLWYPIPPLHS